MKTSVPIRSNWQTVFWCLQIRVWDAVEKVRRCALGCNWCTMVHLEYLELWISMIFAFADGSCLGPPRTKGLVFVVLDSVLLQQRQDAAKRQIENLWECFCAGFAWAKTTQCQEDWTTEGKAEFCLFLFLVGFFVAWSNVMSYDVRCHACVQARLRELRGEDRVAEGQSGIVVWVVVGNPEHFWAPDTAAITTWSDTANHSHSNYSIYSKNSSIGSCDEIAGVIWRGKWRAGRWQFWLEAA